jgi:hypothetical protein
MGVDGRRFRALLAAWLAVFARRGIRVFVPDFSHCQFLGCHHPRKRMIQ